MTIEQFIDIYGISKAYLASRLGIAVTTFRAKMGGDKYKFTTSERHHLLSIMDEMAVNVQRIKNIELL